MSIPAIYSITRHLPIVMICLCLGAITSLAQQPPHWRFWDSRDGMGEGHSRYLQIDSEGNVWITHGAVSSFSQLDGLTVNKIPRGEQFAKISRGRDGQVWADDTNGFRRLENGKWLSYPVEEIATWKRANLITNEDRFFYYPISSEAILYLVPDRISIFNPRTGRTQLFKTAEETGMKSFLDLLTTRNGEVWVTGTKGFAQIRFGNKSQPEWTEHKLEKSGIETLEAIVDGSGGNLYLTGQTGGKKHRLVRFDGHSWNVLYEGNHPFVRGWAEADGTVWLQGPISILRWRNNQLQEVERRGPLSGTIFSATPAGNGAFWVATTQGAARHAPALWRTPDEISGLDNVVHSIYEDPLGRIWAAATNNLLVLEYGKWKRFPVPDGMLTHTYLTRSMSLLPNGKLLVRLDRSPFVYLFDPKNGKFEVLTHPLGHRMQAVSARDKGGVWLWTLGENGRNWLELYDGQEFKSVIELDDRWTKDVRGGIRDMLETENGDLWVGSLNGPGLYQKGHLVDFSTNQEVMQNGVFYLLEMDGGKVWVGGREKIYEYDGANWRVVLQGIDKVRSMIKARDGTVWVAASSGVYRYKQGVWIANTEEDGLPGTIAYDVLEDSQGRIWAGTTRGISLFHQDADPDPPDSMISADNNLRDAPPSGNVRMVFSGVDKWKYTLPERMFFSTRIDGGPWSAFTTAAEAAFKGLPAGAHRFEVRAMDRNGNIDPTPAVFAFRVLLPWYRELGFLLILGFSLAVIFPLTWLAVSNYWQRGRFIQELDQARERYRLLFDSNPLPMWVYDLKTLLFLAVNQSAVNHYGYSLEEFSHMTILDIRPAEDIPRLLSNLAAETPEVTIPAVWRHHKKDGAIIEVEINSHEFVFTGKQAKIVVVNDITERRELERQLQQAQKLESIGQLAAGIAHEINTPTQFVSDNTMFLRDAFTDLSRVIEKNGQLLSVCRSGVLTHEIIAEVELVAKKADVEYLLAEIPKAIEQSLDGTRRIAKIVQSMKDFSHPGTGIKQPSDLNHAIESTITVAQSEWKYVAEMETNFEASLPPVPCLLGEFNQVILNIIVNAAHATTEVVGDGSSGKGKIRVSTRQDGEWAEVSISDSGGGIPEKYRQKIFDPFFTTKQVGKGTGQGLAIAHRVVKKHGGTLTFETEIGKGTTFFIRLPLHV